MVADDGSDTLTIEALRVVARGDTRVRLFELPHRGQIATLNAAVQRCRGELIARLDHDDLANRNRLRRQVEYLDANQDCAAVGTGVRQINADGVLLDSGYRLKLPQSTRTDVRSFPPRLRLIGGSTLMTRRRVLEKVGAFRSAMMAAEDRDLSWRLASVGRLHVISEPLVDHRVHDTNLSTLGARVQFYSSLLADLSAISRDHGIVDDDILAGIEPGGDYDAAIGAYETRLDGYYPVRALVTYLLSSRRARRIEGSLPRKVLFSRGIREFYAHPFSIPSVKALLRATRASLRQ